MSAELLNDNPNRILSNSTLLKIGEQYYQTKMLCNEDFTIDKFKKSDDPAYDRHDHTSKNSILKMEFI